MNEWINAESEETYNNSWPTDIILSDQYRLPILAGLLVV